MLPDWPDPHAIFTLGPLPTRILAGAAGLVLLLGGSRAYRLAVVLPGLLLGVGAALVVGTVLALAPVALAILGVAGGLVGALAAYFLEKFAVVAVGVLGGLGGVQVIWPLVAQGAVPWWAWPAAALVGGVLAPLLWRVALVPLTAWLGAVVLVDTAGVAPHPAVVGGLALVGMVVQWSAGRKRDDED